MTAILDDSKDAPPSDSLVWLVLADGVVDPNEHDCCEGALTARRDVNVVYEGTIADVNDDTPVFITYVVDEDTNEWLIRPVSAET